MDIKECIRYEEILPTLVAFLTLSVTSLILDVDHRKAILKLQQQIYLHLQAERINVSLPLFRQRGVDASSDPQI